MDHFCLTEIIKCHSYFVCTCWFCRHGRHWGSVGRVIDVVDGVVGFLEYCCKCVADGITGLFSQSLCVGECDAGGVMHAVVLVIA